MNTRRHLLWTAGAGTAAVLAAGLFPRRAPAAASSEIFEVNHSDAEWRARLTPEQYNVLRREATERAGSSPLNREHRAGTFSCAGCGLALFSSRPSSTAARAGPASGSRWTRPWQRARTAATAWSAPRRTAAAAAATWAMSSTTARRPRACATA